MEFGNEHMLLFTTAPKKLKYLGMKVTSYDQDPYEENYKTLVKDIKGELSKWKDIPCSGEAGLKIPVLPKFIYTFNTVPIKIPARYFADINKPILKFILGVRRPRLAN